MNIGKAPEEDSDLMKHSGAVLVFVNFQDIERSCTKEME